MKKVKQKFRIILMFSTVLLSKSFYAQVVPNIDWVKHYVSRDSIDNSSTTLDSDNNVYVTGYGFSGTDRDLIVLKYDSLGTLLWSNVYDNGGDDVGTGIKVDINGNVFVCGTSYDATSLNDVVYFVYSSNGTQLAFVRYDAGVNLNDEATDLKINNSSGDAFVIGTSESGTNSDALVIKYNSGWTIDWANLYDSPYGINDNGVALTLTSNNDIFCTGNAFNGSDNDIWVFMLDNSGSIYWNNFVTGNTSGDDLAQAIVTSGDNAIVCGQVYNSTTNEDYTTFRIDGSSNIIWQQNYDDSNNMNFATSLVRDSIGNIGVTGLVLGGSGWEYHTLMYDSTGAQLWVNNELSGVWGAIIEPRIAVDTVAHHFYVSGSRQNTSSDVMVYQIAPTSGITKWKEYYDGPAGSFDVGTGLSVSGLGIVYLSANCMNTSWGYNQTTIRLSQTPVYVPVNYNLQTDTFSYSNLYYPNSGEVLDTSWTPVPKVLFYTKFTYPQQYVLQNRIAFCEHKHDESNPTIADTVSRVDMIFEGANKLTNTYASFYEENSYLNYYLDQTGDITNVKGASSLIVPNIYNLIDLHITSNVIGSKYFFVVKPGGNPNDIKVVLEGAVSTATVSDKLKIDSYLSSWTFSKPDIYNVAYTPSTNVISTTTVTGTNGWTIPASGMYGFNVGTYNHALPLVIEFDMGKPTNITTNSLNCQWSTYVGGSSSDASYDIKSDNLNNTYVVGKTASSNFPPGIGSSPIQPINAGSTDGFIDKYNTFGQRLWSVYVGSALPDQLNSIDVSPNSDIYAVGKSLGILSTLSKTGATNSLTASGNYDGFIIQVNASGNTKQWLTYYGGSQDDDITRCKFDGSGNFFIIGASSSTNISTIGSSPQFLQTNNDPVTSVTDGFIARYNTSSSVTWRTYLGSSTGGAHDKLWDLTFNSNNDLFVVGETSGTNFQNVTNGGSTNYGHPGGAQSKGIITQFSNTGQIIWSTYAGGTGSDYCLSARFRNNKLYVSGKSGSSNFPLLNSGNWYYQGTKGFFDDAVFMVFDNSDVLEHSTFIGGSDYIEFGNRIELDATDKVYICGISGSTTFPTPLVQPANTYIEQNKGGYDYFIYGLQYGSTDVIWATQIGGDLSESLQGFPMMSIDGQNFLHITGDSPSATLFPLFSGNGVSYFDPTHNGSSDVTITRFNLSPINAIGIKEEKNDVKSFITIYPNPTNNNLNLIIDNAMKNPYFYIYNTLGQIVKTGVLEGEKNQIDVRDFKSGIYVIEIKSDNYTETNKFIKSE